jgi:proteasome lid subunit RPN8/RPN11
MDRMIRIRTAVLDAMISHAREDVPLECCGLLLGAGSLVDECVRTRNALASETAYLVDPAEIFAARRAARRDGRAILGAYHSHPRSPAIPSPTDLAEAHDADLLYVIVSLAEAGFPDVRGYRLEEGNFVQTPLVPVP